MSREITPLKPVGRAYEANRTRYLFLFVVILIITIGLRWWGIGQQSLWYDEGWSVHVARQPLGV